MIDKLLILLVKFIQIGFFSIGGGYATIPLIQEQAVTSMHWLSVKEFTDIITISQMTPGPLAVNTSTFVGLRVAGFPGAIVATLGCIFSGFFISIFLYHFFQKHKQNIYITRILQGLRSISAGLIAASASTIILIAFYGTSSINSITEPLNVTAFLIFIVGFAALRKFKLNPLTIIIASGIVGYFVYNCTI